MDLITFAFLHLLHKNWTHLECCRELNVKIFSYLIPLHNDEQDMRKLYYEEGMNMRHAILLVHRVPLMRKWYHSSRNVKCKFLLTCKQLEVSSRILDFITWSLVSVGEQLLFCWVLNDSMGNSSFIWKYCQYGRTHCSEIYERYKREQENRIITLIWNNLGCFLKWGTACICF